MFPVWHPSIFLESCKCSAHPQKKSRSTLSNYRPLSLLTILSKVMETIVKRSVNNFLEHISILSPCQFDFPGGFSTADLLTKLHHEWSKSLASGGAVHVLAIDIAGAFDKVSHPGVLHKAKCYGISGPFLTWLRSYLENRQISRWWPVVNTPQHQSGCRSGEHPRPYIISTVCKRLPRHSPARHRTGHIR